MKHYNSTGGIELTKANTIFVQDNDGHYIAIHEDERELFYKIMEKAYREDDFSEFEKLFPNTCGGCPNRWRKENLK